MIALALLLCATHVFSQTIGKVANSPDAFVPSGYVVTEKISGDLNGDTQKDWVYIIKSTDKRQFVENQFQKIVDRNRRGILIAFAQPSGFTLALENLSCFSSENEDGGVYMPPELNVSIEKGNLYLHYGHGRYGYWMYNFRYQHGDFQLIGYDASDNFGPVTNSDVSVNLITKKARFRQNENADAETDGEERFKTTWKSFTGAKPILLKSIKDIDDIDVLAMLGLPS